MSLGYVIGEVAHFLITTTNRAVAQDIEYGDRGCFHRNNTDAGGMCEQMTEETNCTIGIDECMWDYSGLGEIKY
jgi:hypothetical protein